MTTIRQDGEMKQNDRVPFLSLPAEIVMDILLLGQSMSLAAPFEITVSHVCQRLRDLAIGTAALWANITLTANHDSPQAEAYLIRSQQFPLKISLDFQLPPLDNSDEDIQRACSRIAAHTSHIRALSMRSPSCDEISTVMAQFDGLNLPQLEHLHIECAGGWSLGRPYIFSIFIGASALTSLDIYGSWPDAASPFLPQIQSLRLKLMYARLANHMCDLLPHFANLTELSIERWAPNGPMPTISLPYLRSLTILHPTEDDCMFYICSTLITPALESLVFKGPSSTSIPRFLALMTTSPPQSYPSLYTLSFFSRTATSTLEINGVTEPCHPFDTVRHLTLINIATTSFFLEELYRDDSSLFPGLRTITLVHPDLGEQELYMAISSWEATGMPLPILRVPPSLSKADGHNTGRHQGGIEIETLTEFEVSGLTDSCEPEKDKTWAYQ